MAKFIEFLKSSAEELRKVTWPTKDEVVRATTAVVVFVAVFSAILFGVDIAVRVFLQGLMS